ncbi:hypothetical protein HK105_208129 [Polyrhizophydium stewartii]|uniref:Protein kinase domain-containing protein n=1 Tax=Polyrhizophydium stewartii TaxID=2732419 RepID=A0ABR4MYP5_9FUNG
MDLGASAGAGAGDHSRSGSAAPKSASKAHLSAKARHSAAATSGAASSPSGQPLPAQQTFKARQNLQMGGRALGAVSSSITGSRDLDGDRKEAIRHVRSEDLAELDEAYLMKDTIGQGAFGIVKLCEHKATGKVYACKIVKKRIGSTSSYEQLQREVNIMKAVHHPNIVQLKEVIESPKKMCMVME